MGRRHFRLNGIANYFQFTLLLISTGLIGCDNWAVSVPDGAEHADIVAGEHGLINRGEVLPESNIFHFEKIVADEDHASPTTSRRRRRSAERANTHRELRDNRKVSNLTLSGPVNS